MTLILFLFKREQYQRQEHSRVGFEKLAKGGFKKPAVVRFKNPTSTAFRVSWHTTPIRVKKKLENLPQYVHKWTCMGKCTLGARKVYTQAAGAVSVQYYSGCTAEYVFALGLVFMVIF